MIRPEGPCGLDGRWVVAHRCVEGSRCSFGWLGIFEALYLWRMAGVCRDFCGEVHKGLSVVNRTKVRDFCGVFAHRFCCDLCSSSLRDYTGFSFYLGGDRGSWGGLKTGSIG